MNRWSIGALVSALAFAGAVQASTVTVVGSMGGQIWYDGKDVGTVPLRLTAVPAGRHVVRVVTPNGLDRTFDLDYPRGRNVDRVVDMDVEMSRRDPTSRGVLPQVVRQQPMLEYVEPSGSDYYRNYDSRDYQSNYGSYPYGYNQPYYGGNSYGYGGYPGYYDTFGGALPFLGSGAFLGRNRRNRDFSRDRDGSRNRDFSSRSSRSSAPAFPPPSSSSGSFGGGGSSFSSGGSAFSPPSSGSISPSFGVNSTSAPSFPAASSSSSSTPQSQPVFGRRRPGDAN